MGGDTPPQRPVFPRENSVTQWDVKDLTLERAIPIKVPYQLETGLGGVWVTSWAGGRSSQLTKVDPTSGEILSVWRHLGDPGSLTISGGFVWELAFIPPAATHGWTLLQIDPSTAEVVHKVAVGGFGQGDPLSLASSGHILAVASFFEGQVLLFDARSGTADSSYAADLRIRDVSIGSQGLWLAGGHLLLELDRQTGDVLRMLRVTGAPLRTVEQTADAVWVMSRRGVFQLAPQ
jgi:hypothetical protein